MRNRLSSILYFEVIIFHINCTAFLLVILNASFLLISVLNNNYHDDNCAKHQLFCVLTTFKNFFLTSKLKITGVYGLLICRVLDNCRVIFGKLCQIGESEKKSSIQMRRIDQMRTSWKKICTLIVRLVKIHLTILKLGSIPKEYSQPLQ